MERVVTDPGLVRDLRSSHYGEETDDGLELAPVEAAYLVEKGTLDGSPQDVLAEMAGDGFEARFLVYRDFRNRGFYLSPGGAAADFLVYPRGEHPGSSPAKFFVHVASERDPLPIAKMVRWVDHAANLNRTALLSLVDEEGDITHYELSEPSVEGDAEPGDAEADGRLVGDRVLTDETRLHEEEFYGQPLGDLVQLSITETHHLLDQNRLDLDVTEKEFNRAAAELEEEFNEKTRLYDELRDVGVVPKTGFKFGSHFRTYSYFDGLDDFPHAEKLIHALQPSHVFDPPEFSRAVRLAQSVRKEMVFASLEENIRYLHAERIRP